MTFGRILVAQALAAAISLAVLGGSAAADPLVFKDLNLLNDWVSYGVATRTPSVAIDDEAIVYLRGAVRQESGLNGKIAVLPKPYRPKHVVYIPVTLVTGHKGEILINLGGDILVQSAGNYADAQAFTSLEGVSFPRNN
jgi:hypothetical protein